MEFLYVFLLFLPFQEKKAEKLRESAVCECFAHCKICNFFVEKRKASQAPGFAGGPDLQKDRLDNQAVWLCICGPLKTASRRSPKSRVPVDQYVPCLIFPFVWFHMLAKDYATEHHPYTKQWSSGLWWTVLSIPCSVSTASRRGAYRVMRRCFSRYHFL